MNLTHIEEKLKEAFSGSTRSLIFWYDDEGQFAEDIDALSIPSVKIHLLEERNQFYTKYLLERRDAKSNYLIYAPFPKPDVRDNHLEDTLLYSKRFYADKVSLLAAEKGISEKLKPVLQKYSKFFESKERNQRFDNLEIENDTPENIEVALMSVLTRSTTATFDEVARAVLGADLDDENKYLLEFEKYGLTEAFWRHCDDQFGYADTKSSISSFAAMLLLTCASKQLGDDTPEAWKDLVSAKYGNVIALISNLMNSVLYREMYDALASRVSSQYQVPATLSELPTEALLGCYIFGSVDEILIGWINDHLLAEDTNAELAGHDISEICAIRSKLHFGETFSAEYDLLASAIEVISATGYQYSDEIVEIANQYTETYFRIDRNYRSFYLALDRLADADDYEELRLLVERIYSNEYLEKIIPAWNRAISVDGADRKIGRTEDFFFNHIATTKEKTAVIISDALRYEVGRQLFEKLADYPNCAAMIHAEVGMLPSFTPTGVAALLPHDRIDLQDDGSVLLDGAQADTLEKREQTLQKKMPQSRCVRFDDITSSKNEQRELFNGMDVVYIFHNQIDARGDNAATENEVFTACAEAVDEIFSMIKRLASNVSISKFIITADHGFLYKRDKLPESDKIDTKRFHPIIMKRRFILSESGANVEGVMEFSSRQSSSIGQDRFLSVPLSSHIFKVSGGGQNYVHGGSSPQEMLLPVIEVRVEKGKVETIPVKIALVSVVNKITNLVISFDFMQSDAVGDSIVPAEYKISFLDGSGTSISNEYTYVADSKAKNPQDRMFSLRFTFKNRKYAAGERCELVIKETKSGMAILRHEVIMDLAFSDDFGF
ncbi:MAG: BREX-1 system phosphatase PglZ type A [Clostridiales Family XIII bacterium]|jgi:uncharacterized protein (TIGR02687 family)|nr:BREX-1 system phosphatase PglZ type A [Clostridiales Family XIII bacterium]